MKTQEKNSQLDQAERVIIKRLETRMTDPRFSGDPSYVIAIRHAIDVVRLESGIARGQW